MSVIIRRYEYIRLVSDERESEAVKLALLNMRRDLMRVLECRTNISVFAPQVTIVIGTVGVCPEIEKKADIELLKDENGDYRKEAFLIQEKNGELLIAGTDRRGTIYGIYDFCEWLGVSPWYFFADVPVRARETAVIEDGYCKMDYPSVEYRGIFINDEEELENWAQRYIGEETIGVKTYEKIFELLLRLKLNYIWPAMHVNSFNMKPENGALADRLGIVVGTSHCDMLMRSNNREWKPWIEKKGYTDAAYDFSIPGKNREILKEYWRESIEQNKNFEVCYTLGMRGIHDSGFETKTLKNLTGNELLKAKMELLDSVIKTQEDLLKETLGRETLKTFIPYKEVLELYDNGLEIQEDLTMVWVNDNYGYIRRYPGEREKKRAAGHGIYYHNSYWAAPESSASYLFITTIPLAHTRNELKKAWNEGIRKLWVTNFGALKPLEQQMAFYARLAWDAGKQNPIIANEEEWLVQWIDSMFSGAVGTKLAPILLEFDQLTNVRKLEHMDCDVFSQTAYGDEAVTRIHRYEMIFDKVNTIYDQLPRAEKDAFFQLVLMKIHAAYFTNCMYYYADRSNLCIEQGKMRAAKEYTEKSLNFDYARRKILHYYNHVMSNGKWNGILTPEDFPPPRTAMYPACMPPLYIGEKKPIITIWNDGESLEFTRNTAKWIEIANAGIGSVSYRIQAPQWLEIESGSGIVSTETRILISVDAEQAMVQEERGETKLCGLIVIWCDNQIIRKIPVRCNLKTFCEISEIPFEDDGRICAEASQFLVDECREEGWKQISNLGRSEGILLEAKHENALVSYPVFFLSQGHFVLEIHRFPSLNSVGRIRVGISIDDGEVQITETLSSDAYRADWLGNARNEVDKLYTEITIKDPGIHRVTFHTVDKYFAFSRFVIYTVDRKENNLGIAGGDQHLPQEFEAVMFADDFYGMEEPAPRPVLYMPLKYHGDSTTKEDIYRLEAEQGKRVEPEEILAGGRRIFTEQDGCIRIDAAAALADTEFAYAKGDCWKYCNSPSYADTGLAMYIRDAALSWSEPESAPSLHYKLRTDGGKYRIWVRVHMWGKTTSHMAIGIDGMVVPEDKLYNGQGLWKYANEQVWKWIPLWETELAEGEHELVIYSMSSHLRFDRIYLTKREELP